VPQQRAEEMKRTGIVVHYSPGGDRMDQVRRACPPALHRAAIPPCIAGWPHIERSGRLEGTSNRRWVG
jgi:hypothetical protein